MSWEHPVMEGGGAEGFSGHAKRAQDNGNLEFWVVSHVKCSNHRIS